MPSDFDRFIAHARGERGGFFEASRPITVARAPGWVDLLGGPAAYGGALALGWPTAGSTFVALQPNPEPLIRIRVHGIEHCLDLDALVEAGAPREYTDIAERVAAYTPTGAPWWSLVIGAWAALMREEFARFTNGARLIVQPAAGPGAEAGWVTATAQALVSAYAVRIAPRELALDCQVAMERVAGLSASSLGVMVSVCAPDHELLLLHPQPAWHWGNLHLPHGVTVWSVQVGTGPGRRAEEHVRTAGQMAYHMAADAAGLSREQADARWLGYLANIGTAVFERRYRGLLPAQLSGAEFLAHYPAPAGSMIDPQAIYPLREVASLAVETQLRSRTAVALLRAAAAKAQREEDLSLVGELMAQCHWAQVAAGLSDIHADRLVDEIYSAGPQQGLFGARAPAAECGATLVVLGWSSAEATLMAIAERYAAESGQPVKIFGGSAPGCNSAGTREV